MAIHADPLLLLMAEVANKSDENTFRVTLNVNGTIVSGILVGAEQYRKGQAADMVKVGMSQAVADALLELVKDTESLAANGTGATYLHLREARFIQAGISMPDGV